MNANFLSIAFFLLLLYSSCRTSDNQAELDSTSAMQYARGLNIESKGDSYLVTISEPWKKDGVSRKYHLIPNKGNVAVEEGAQVINIPLEKVAAMSTTHVGFLSELGGREKIVGVNGADLVYDPILRERRSKGLMVELGDASGINFEVLLSCRAEAILAYSLGDFAYLEKKIKDTGVIPIVVTDFMEESALGRAEWIKFFGLLIGKEAEAEKIFAKVLKNFESVKAKIPEGDTAAKIMTGMSFEGIWYVPGGKSFLATMIKEAGGDYLWADNDSRSSLMLDIEGVLQKTSAADIWIDVGDVGSLLEMMNADSRYKNFAPFQKKKVFNYSKRVSPRGGYDIFETGAARPDRVLNDLVRIFHQKNLHDDELFYYEQLNE